MSIFDGFTERMSRIFRVSSCSYKSSKGGITTRYKMLNMDYRDPSTYPLPTGGRIPPDIRTDYVLVDTRFECVLNGKRVWVYYNDIFKSGSGIMSINDFIVNVALDGDFDKDLPMYNASENEPKELKHNDWYHPYMWSNIPLQPNCSKYWKIVASHMRENILSHIKDGSDVNVVCEPDDCGSTTRCSYKIYLEIKKVNNNNCYWFDIDGILKRFGNRNKADANTPVIIFDLILSKD